MPKRLICFAAEARKRAEFVFRGRVNSLIKSNSGYADIGYEVIPRAFSSDSLEAVAQTLRGILMKNHEDTGQSLDDLLLEGEAEKHSLIYDASQSLGSSATTYNLLGSSGILNTACLLTG